MKSSAKVMHVVLDFDGTCTQIPKVWETYLELYFKGLVEAGFKITGNEWREACTAVQKHRPMPDGRWPAAPAGADPYILADPRILGAIDRSSDPIGSQRH